jgi:hypothetical protein
VRSHRVLVRVELVVSGRVATRSLRPCRARADADAGGRAGGREQPTRQT